MSDSYGLKILCQSGSWLTCPTNDANATSYVSRFRCELLKVLYIGSYTYEPFQQKQRKARLVFPETRLKDMPAQSVVLRKTSTEVPGSWSEHVLSGVAGVAVALNRVHL